MIIQGDCIEQMKQLPDNSVDAIVTDPPYGLEFMGKNWDYGVPGKNFFIEMIRVLKPGGFLLAFGGTRTYHRLACGIEDAGFEIRDCMSWIYGAGFPKSLNVHKQIQKVYKCGNTSINYGEQNTQHDLRLMSKTNLQKTINSKNKYGEVLQSQLQEQSSQETMYGKESKEGKLGQEESSMEGRSNLFQDQGKLQGCEICKMPKEISCYVKKGWLYNGTQINNGKIFKEDSKENRSDTPQRPQSREQQDRESYAICEQCRTQILRKHEGIGTALKPAQEMIVVARKPLSEKNVALNVLKWGTGGINIDACRIGYKSEKDMEKAKVGFDEEDKVGGVMGIDIKGGLGLKGSSNPPNQQGRFPANIILDEEAGKMLDEQSGILKKGGQQNGSIRVGKKITDGEKTGNKYGKYMPVTNPSNKHLCQGEYGASRFFYCAKASKSERNLGCEDMPLKHYLKENKMGGEGDTMLTGSGNPRDCRKHNFHPTVKPIKLMEYLIKLVSREGATILDPFMGSGTTGCACAKLNRKFIGIEKEEEYIKIAEARIKAHKPKEQTLQNDMDKR